MSPVSPLPSGLDVGNALTKGIFGSHQVRIPSYLQPIHGPLHQLPSKGYVDYLAGNCQAFHGKRWLIGSVAYQQNPEAYQRVADDKQAKVTQALPLILGALSHLPFQERWDIQLVASIHHAREMSEALQQALEGTHTVLMNDQPDPCHVSITMLRVLDEGAGAVATAGLTTGQNLVYDIGGGTTIISVFGEKGRLIDRQVSPGGVNTLIAAIAKNSDLIRQEAGEGDRETIRRCLENGSFQYGLHQPVDLRPIYEAELRPWLATVLRSALKAGSKWQRNCDQVLAIGGGAQLPLVGDILSRQDIHPMANSAWSNVRGLQQIAALLTHP
ncbi:MAG: ParM/StbA family protein [Cyanobacteria bacterium J06597_16]